MSVQGKEKILISCARGVTPYLRAELETLLFLVLAEGVSWIVTEGMFEDTLMLNLHLRTAQRVYYRIAEFGAGDPGDVYRGVNRLPWEYYLPEDGYFSVACNADAAYVRDPRYLNQKVKDAVVDRIRRIHGRRPDSGPERDKAVVYVYWKEGLCSVYLDTSGESLSKRGYRKDALVAPMQEALAAAVLHAAGWDGKGNLINPMCGSGTLAIEAALIALRIAPGLLRGNFGFMHLKPFDRRAWDRMTSGAKQMIRKEMAGEIIATDASRAAIDASRRNARSAGVEPFIRFGVCDFAATPVLPGGGMVIMNPEYGERLGEAEGLETTYGGMGDFLKKKCQGYRGYIFTGNLVLAKKVGLRTKRRIPLYNGPIECRLLEYELYAHQGKKFAEGKGDRHEE